MEPVYDQSLLATQRSLHSAADGQRFCSSNQDRRHFAAIDNGIRHMQLDSHFLSRSQLWRQQQPQQQLLEHQSRALSAMQNGQSFMQDYKSTMNHQHVESLRENQVEANRDAALQGLYNFRREFDPVARQSHDRVQQFCDWIGVTDRFTGFRNNLTRGSRQPLEFSPQWRRGEAGQGLPGLVHPKFVPETLNTANVHRFNLRAASAPAARSAQAATARPATPCATAQKSPQERAGIPTKFPGSTEYYDRYTRPQTARTKFDYTINPQPDFTILGRKMLKAETIDRRTEYDDRYLWPDSRNLQQTPWNKRAAN